MKKDDFTVHNYQDDLDTDPEKTDPVMFEQTDDPVRDLNIPPKEMKDELDGLDPEVGEDARERVEDIDDERGARNNE